MAQQYAVAYMDRDGIPELTSTNWPEWSFKMTNYLESLELLEFVESEPQLSTENPSEYTDEDKRKSASARLARNKILSRVSYKFRGYLRSCTTAKQVWDKFERLYVERSKSQLTHLKHAFGYAKMAHDEDIDDYISRVVNLATDLTDYGEEVSESTTCSTIIRGLSPTFKHLVHILENQDVEHTIESVRRAIFRFKATENLGKSLSAITVNSTSKTSKYCTHCKKHGHLANECWTLKRKKAQGAKEDSHSPEDDEVPAEDGDTSQALAYTAIAVQPQRMQSRLPHNLGKPITPKVSYGLASKMTHSDMWIIDSGASFHMTGDPDILEPGTIEHVRMPVMCAEGSELMSEAKGSALIHASDGTPIQLLNVYYIPGFKHNLFSVNALVRATGARVVFTQGVCRIESAAGVVEAPLTQDRVYALVVTARRWHERLGHPSESRMKLMGLPHRINGTCTPCIQGKQTACPYHPSGYNYEPLDLVYVDLVGPLPETMAGQRYYLSMYDQSSKVSMVYVLPNKNHTAAAVMEGISTYEKIAQAGRKVKAIRSDQGTEFLTQELKNFLQARGIVHETTAGYTPQQNAAERLQRSLNDSARTMLAHAKLPEAFWGEAIRCANYLRNRTPVSLSADGKTPLEILTGVTPAVKHLRVFGCEAWVLVPEAKRTSKFASRSVRGVFLGYQNNSTYRVLVDDKILTSRNVSFVEDKLGILEQAPNGQPDVVADLLPEPPQFDGELDIESQVTQPSLSEVRMESRSSFHPISFSSCRQEQISTAKGPLAAEDIVSTGGPVEVNLADNARTEEETQGPQASSSTLALQEPPAAPNLGNLQPIEDVEAPALPSLGDLQPIEDVEAPAVDGMAPAIPSHPYNLRPRASRALEAKATRQWELENDFSGYERAMARPDAELWKEAINDELASLAKNDTWRVTTLPHGRLPLTTTWVFKVKTKGDGQVERYKARLCVRGFQQRIGLDYQEVFAPTSGKVAQRTFLTHATLMDYEIQQVDIKTAFLNAQLNEDIYLEIPQGLKEGLEHDPRGKQVLKLNKSLYGLKQAPRLWHQHLTQTLKTELGFVCNPVDDTILKCIHSKSGKECLILIYVDDLLIAAEDLNTTRLVIESICRKYDARDLGPASFFCGMVIQRDRKKRVMYLSEQDKIKKLIKQFNMDNSRPRRTPLDFVLSQGEEEEACPAKPFQALVGSLLYLSTTTRPDLGQAASQLSRYMAQPKQSHWEAAKNVLRYLKTTVNYGLCLGDRIETLQRDFDQQIDTYTLTGYCDADYATDKERRKSRTGYVFMLNGSLLSWQSKLQATVSSSTTEAEYQSASSAVKEGLWLKNLLIDLTSGKVKQQIQMYCDNQACIKIVQNSGSMVRTKHIDVAHHFVRERVLFGEVCFQYCDTSKMLADFLTKPSKLQPFWNCVTGIGLTDLADPSLSVLLTE